MNSGDSPQPTPHESTEHQQQRLLDALVDSASLLNQTPDLQTVLNQILEKIELVIPHQMAAVMVVEGNIGRVVAVRSKITPNLAPYQVSIPISDIEIIGLIRETRQPCIVNDTQTDPRWIEVPNHKTLRSAICVPLFSKDEFLGCLVLLASPIGYFNNKSAEQIQRFGVLISLAITNARLRQKAQELVVMQERQHHARDLHDSLTQTLFSASTIAEALKVLGDSAEKAPSYIDMLANMTREAMVEMRSLLLELHPEVLLKTELFLIIKQLCDTFSLKTRISLDFQATGRLTLPEQVHFVFYRVAQEALNNIRKHANATQVKVSLKVEFQRIELTIQDNGIGFDVYTQLAAHTGLSNLRKRAEQLQAQLIVYSLPGQGTEITLKYQVPYLAC